MSMKAVLTIAALFAGVVGGMAYMGAGSSGTCPLEALGLTSSCSSSAGTCSGSGGGCSDSTMEAITDTDSGDCCASMLAAASTKPSCCSGTSAASAIAAAKPASKDMAISATIGGAGLAIAEPKSCCQEGGECPLSK